MKKLRAKPRQSECKWVRGDEIKSYLGGRMGKLYMRSTDTCYENLTVWLAGYKGEQ